MQFQVPQFIDREPKVVGPFTFKQFIYVGTAGASAFFLFLVIGSNVMLFLPIAAVIIGLGLSLAFLKVEGKPFPNYLASMFLFLISPRTYSWHRDHILMREQKHIEKKELSANRQLTPEEQNLSARKSKIRDLSTKIEMR